MPTTPLFPLPEGLEITSISETSGEVLVRITSHRTLSLCPLCSTPSSAIHSYYRRKLLDLPCAGRSIRVLLTVKKFFCRQSGCERKIFVERLPDFVAVSSRLAMRLRTLVQAIGISFNANGGARLAEQMGVQVSRRTVLFSLHLLPVPLVGQIKRVGIDDFAWKRGVRYGTVLIDLDSHHIIDILADRETESVKQWLQSHHSVNPFVRKKSWPFVVKGIQLYTGSQ